VKRFTSVGVSVFAIAVAAAGWELVAVYGSFPPKLFPGLGAIAQALVRVAGDGVLLAAAEATLVRLVAGFAIAAVIGVLVGILMGRYQWLEDMLLPVVSFFNPIPGVAYAPLFVLWFGLGDFAVILLVGLNSCLPIIVNVWTGTKAVKPIWLRCAQVMGARDREIFWRIILPAALPDIFTGLRIGLSNAWRILIAVEMLMAVSRGLGWMIFGAQEFLNTDIMLATIAVIGVIGIGLEWLFARLERGTVVRWGMMNP